MPSSNVCWGVEVGAGAVKAIKLVREGDALNVADFAVIPHAKVLSTPDIDQVDAIRVALGALVSQHDLSKSSLAISMPGHAGFVRFAKLPPVEPKKVPDIVKFEAVQQIPFPIEEVEWDYQTFVSPGSPDVEVGIFAIKRERVLERLAVCADVNLSPDFLNLSPVAVYNAVAYDLHFSETTPGIVLVDIGATATDLIVAEAGRVWIRTFPLGGHHFTEALASTFRLNYSKAEKLKREAAQHEHKNQIFQGMKPVYSDLAQDVQRSLAYYRQLHPESDLKKVIGFGSTFRLTGLRKFLSQQLQMDVVRFDKLSRLTIEGAKASDLQSAALNMATAYGLAVQGLGLASIDANLIPRSVIRESVWKRKIPWVAAAATLALAAGGISFYRPLADSSKVEQARAGQSRSTVEQVKNLGKTLMDEWKNVEKDASIGFAAENVRRLPDRRGIYSHLVSDLSGMLASAEPQPDLLAGGGADIPPGDRRLFQVRSFETDYLTPSGGAASGAYTDVGGSGSAASSSRASDNARSGSRSSGGSLMGAAEAGGGGQAVSPRSAGRDRPPKRDDDDDENGESPAGQARPLGSVHITLVVDSTHKDKQAFVDKHLLQWLRDNAERPDAPYRFVTGTVDEMVKKFETVKPEAAGKGAASRPGQPAAGSQPRAGGALGGQRPPSGGESKAQAGSIDALAPLPQPASTLPPDADVHRYTIQWEAVLVDPNAPKPSRDADQDEGQARQDNDQERER